MLDTSVVTVDATGQLFIRPEHFEAVTYMALAFRAYTARHDPSIDDCHRRWVELCQEAGEKGRLPPFAPLVSNYATFVVTPAVHVIPTTEVMTTGGLLTYAVFIRKHMDTITRLAKEDALVRWLSEHFKNEYAQLAHLIDLLDCYPAQ
jgi:hypothetical protein